MIRYFFGDDTITARDRISSIAKKENASIRWVDKEDITQQSLESLLDTSYNLLFGKTVIVLRDASSFPEDIRNELLELIEKGFKTGELIIWDRTIPDARLTFTKKMKASANSESFLQPKDEQSMVAWVAQNQKDSGDTKLSPVIITEIVRRVGNDVVAVSSEIAKCRMLGASAMVQDVARIVPERQIDAGSAFPLLEAIVRRQGASAVHILGTMINGGSSERFILSMLAYQFRLFLAVRIGRDKNADVLIIHRATGFHPVAIQKALPAVSRMSLAAITDALIRIHATEKSINTSSMDARSMVTMLVVSLCRS